MENINYFASVEFNSSSGIDAALLVGDIAERYDTLGYFSDENVYNFFSEEDRNNFVLNVLELKCVSSILLNDSFFDRKYSRLKNQIEQEKGHRRI